MFYPIIYYIAIFSTIIHLWIVRPFSNGVCVAVTIGLLLFGWIGLIAYWVYFLVKRPDRIPVVQTDDSLQQASSVTEDSDVATPDVVNAENEELSLEDDLQRMRSLFNQTMNGVNGAALSKAYSKMMELFTIKANGDCKAAGLSGLMWADERAKKIAKMDDTVVLPALGHDKELYEAWWMTFYQDAEQTINESANSSVRAYMNAVVSDVELGDEVLTKSGVFEAIYNPELYVGYDEKSVYYDSVCLTDPNGGQYETYMDVKILKEGRKMTVRTSEHRINIKSKTKGNNVRYEICGAYKYFPYGLSLDPMIKYAEMLMAAATLHILNKKQIDNASMEKYALPSLSKLN